MVFALFKPFLREKLRNRVSVPFKSNLVILVCLNFILSVWKKCMFWNGWVSGLWAWGARVDPQYHFGVKKSYKNFIYKVKVFHNCVAVFVFFFQEEGREKESNTSSRKFFRMFLVPEVSSHSFPNVPSSTKIFLSNFQNFSKTSANIFHNIYSKSHAIISTRCLKAGIYMQTKWFVNS